jgi:hypothetical protein
MYELLMLVLTGLRDSRPFLLTFSCSVDMPWHFHISIPRCSASLSISPPALIYPSNAMLQRLHHRPSVHRSTFHPLTFIAVLVRTLHRQVSPVHR